ncbi:MAG: hypothetical protein U7M05_10460 [Candidatus Igneacidithiobacillus chanchocoensis]
MTMKTASLADLFAKHEGKVSDKWSLYLTEYDRLFEPYRHQPIALLEIGIQNGGSLEIWAEFFKKAKAIVGCDINPACANLAYDDARLHVVALNANTDDAESRILECSPQFELIIDDGSHRSGDIVHSFSRYFRHVADGGLYIAEDLHCSYWGDYDGGLYQPCSSLAFFKLLADAINHEHWGIDSQRADLFRDFTSKYGVDTPEEALASVHSVEFLNSICVIRKSRPENNTIGPRRVSGQVATVETAVFGLNGTDISHPDQSANVWAFNAQAEHDGLKEIIQTLATLTRQIENKDREIQQLAALTQEQERDFIQALQALQQTQDAQREETNRALALREQALNETLGSARQQADEQQLALIEQGQAITLQLQALQQTHEEQTTTLIHAHAEREQSLNAQLTLALQQMEGLSLQSAERERALSQQLQDAQRVHDQQRAEQLRAQVEREQALSAEHAALLRSHQAQVEALNTTHAERTGELERRLIVAQEQTEALTQQGIAREEAISAQLLDLHHKHDQQRQALDRDQAERDRNLHEQIAHVQEQLDRQVLLGAEREKALSEQLRVLQQTHIQESQALHQQHAERELDLKTNLSLALRQIEALVRQGAEREAAFALQLQTQQQSYEQKQQTLEREFETNQTDWSRREAQWEEERAQQASSIAALQVTMQSLEESFSWRWTAPLRRLAIVIRHFSSR